MRDATRNTRWTLGLGVAALVMVGCSVALSRRELYQPMVVAAPARPVSLEVQTVAGPRLPHARHLDLGIGCADCHEPDATGEPGRPTLGFCLDCHAEMEEDEQVPPEKRIASVFFSPDEKPKWVRAIRDYEPGFEFRHANHKTVECKDCHTSLDDLPRRRVLLYDMDGCLDCHRQRGSTQSCADCHAAVRDDVEPPDHLVEWETRHGPAVREAQDRGEDPNCHYCHRDPNYCNECHFTERPTTHLCGWELEHGRRVLEACGPGEARCTYCHVDQAFCDDCHMTVKPSSHKHMWIRRHGLLTRTQHIGLSAGCRFCHDAPSFCEDCHRDMEPRDHTALFRTRTHGLVASVDRTRCRVCHLSDFCIRCHEYTSPRSHRGQWARGRNTHCAVCHVPLGGSCVVCHKGMPAHATAPTGHLFGTDCRVCHNPAGGGGAPPLRHVDPGTPCEACHR